MAHLCLLSLRICSISFTDWISILIKIASTYFPSLYGSFVDPFSPVYICVEENAFLGAGSQITNQNIYECNKYLRNKVFENVCIHTMHSFIVGCGWCVNLSLSIELDREMQTHACVQMQWRSRKKKTCSRCDTKAQVAVTRETDQQVETTWGNI